MRVDRKRVQEQEAEAKVEGESLARPEADLKFWPKFFLNLHLLSGLLSASGRGEGRPPFLVLVLGGWI